MPLQLKESDLPSLTSKTALVTGGTSGIGLQTAILLASQGATVHIASRTAAAGEATVAGLRAQYPSHTYHYHLLDLSNVASAAASAAHFARDNARLDILVANAGVSCVPVDVLSPDGLDMAFAVNHVGHFVFISGLLPLLRRTAAAAENGDGDVRVVITASNAYKFVDRVDLSDVERRVPGDGDSPRHLPAAMRRYGRSKRANILFAMELDRRLRAPDGPGGSCTGVRVNVCHPGTIGATRLGDGVLASPSLTILYPFWFIIMPPANEWMGVLLERLWHDGLGVGAHSQTRHHRRYYPARGCDDTDVAGCCREDP